MPNSGNDVELENQDDTYSEDNENGYLFFTYFFNSLPHIK
jgi:hypothetical protein